MLLRWRPGRRGALAALAVVAGLTLGAPSASAQATSVPGPIVLIGTGGVRWSDTAPSSASDVRTLLGDGAVAEMSVRSVRTSTCAVDGWLVVSAGARAADEPGPCRTPAFTASPTPGSPASVARWGVYTRLATASSDDAHPGPLGATLSAASAPPPPAGPGAAIALADDAGRAAAAWPGLPARPDG